MHRHAPQSRRQIAGDLWPELSDEQALARLRKALNELHERFQCFRRLCDIDRYQIAWRAPAEITVDVEVFEQTLRQAASAGSHSQQISHLQAALALYGGEFLPELDSLEPGFEWVATLRERLYQSYVAALMQLADHLVAAGQLDEAFFYAQQLLSREPEYEEHYVRLIGLCGRLGKRQEIEHLYHDSLHMLDGLKTQASQALKDAYAQALLQTQALHFDPLPQSPTPFVGRDADLAQIERWLADPAIRLINIVGFGGIGKTRLALEAGARFGRRFAHGVCFASLVALTPSDSLLTTLAAALHCPLSNDQEPQTTVLRFLSERHLLLILDNFEQVADQAPFLAAVAQRSPWIKIIVTSRSVLNLPSEWVYALAGMKMVLDRPDSLALPSSPEVMDRLSNASPTCPDGRGENAWLQSDAARLFVLHPQRQQRDFHLAGNEQVIAEICAQVYGTPLAIELLASWTPVYSCAEILRRLRESFHFLGRRRADPSDRHGSMYAAFEQTWLLLNEQQRRIFAQLSVFRGGFSLEAASAVTDVTAEQLAALVDRCLVRQSAGGRYEVHELLRQFGGDKLEDEPAWPEAAAERHCHYYVALLRQYQDALSAGRAQVFRLLRADTGNIRQMLRWAVERRQSQPLIDLALALYFFFEGQGWAGDGEALFAWASGQWQQTPIQSDAERLAYAYLKFGELGCAALSGGGQQLVAEAARIQAIFAEAGEIKGVAIAYPLLQQALAVAEPLHFVYAMGAAYYHLGEIERVQGNHEQAERYYGESLLLARQSQSVRGISISLAGLGALAYSRGDYSQAQRLLGNSVQEAQKADDGWVINTVNYLDICYCAILRLL